MNIVLQQYLSLYPAQIFALMSANLSGIVNGIIVGNFLDPSAMVAVGFVTPVMTIIAALSSIVAGGARVLCGRALGRGDFDGINRIFTISVQMLSVLGLFLMLVLELIPVPIARLLGAGADNVGMTAMYLRGLAVGLVPILLNPCLMAFMQLGNESGRTMIYSLITAGIDFMLTFVMVYFLKTGIFGAGIATAASQLILLAVIAAHFKRDGRLMRYTKKSFSAGAAKTLFVLGCPAALASVLYSVRNIYFNTLALRFGGAEAVGAMAILMTFDSLYGAINVATGSSVMTLSSVAVGERDADFLTKMLKQTMLFSVLLGLLEMAVMIPLGRPVARLMGAGPERTALVVAFFFIFSFTKPTNMVQAVLMNMHTALGHIGFVNITCLLTAIGFSIPCAYIPGLLFGIKGMWWNYTLSEILTFIFIMIVTTARVRRFPKSASDMLWLDGNFGGGEHLSFTVRSAAEAVTVSEKVQSFILSQGIDSRRAMLGGLCLEEMAVNVAEHGFTKTKRKCSINIFVRCENGEVMLRIRDNAPPFDPHTRAGAFDPEDPAKSVGIRMVIGLSKSTEYRSVFGMNVLTITI